MFRLPMIGIRQHYPRAKTNVHFAAIHADFLKRNAKPKPQISPIPVAARIDIGQWCFDCPHCHTGVAATPPTGEWLSRCFGCGAVFPEVIFPQEWRVIERLLEVRPQFNQGWKIGQSVDELRAENIENGLPGNADQEDPL